MSLTVVKLGSTLVADDVGDVRTDVLREVCRQVGAIHTDDDGSAALVTSGAIALGMRKMGRPVRPTAIEELQAASAVGQGPLYDVYAELLGEHGVAAAQVLLTFLDISAREQYVNARRTLAKLLDWEVVPIINENDTTATDEITFGDNDFLAAQVAILMAADLLVVLSDVDGLFTGDPAKRLRRLAGRGGATTSRSCRTTRSACRARTSARAACAARCCARRWPPPRASRS